MAEIVLIELDLERLARHFTAAEKNGRVCFGREQGGAHDTRKGRMHYKKGADAPGRLGGRYVFSPSRRDQSRPL